MRYVLPLEVPLVELERPDAAALQTFLSLPSNPVVAFLQPQPRSGLPKRARSEGSPPPSHLPPPRGVNPEFDHLFLSACALAYSQHNASPESDDIAAASAHGDVAGSPLARQIATFEGELLSGQLADPGCRQLIELRGEEETAKLSLAEPSSFQRESEKLYPPSTL